MPGANTVHALHVGQHVKCRAVIPPLAVAPQAPDIRPRDHRPHLGVLI